MLLANFGKETRPDPLIAKISQETLARMIGTTRARFFMNKVRKLGFISYNGRIEVHSSLLNVVLHDQPHIKKLNKFLFADVSNSDQPTPSPGRIVARARRLAPSPLTGGCLFVDGLNSVDGIYLPAVRGGLVGLR